MKVKNCLIIPFSNRGRKTLLICCRFKETIFIFIYKTFIIPFFLWQIFQIFSSLVWIKLLVIVFGLINLIEGLCKPYHGIRTMNTGLLVCVQRACTKLWPCQHEGQSMCWLGWVLMAQAEKIWAVYRSGIAHSWGQAVPAWVLRNELGG